MSEDRDRRALELLQAVLDVPEEERERWLEEETDGDAELRREVESLLEAHDRTSGILDRPLATLREGRSGGTKVLGEEEVEPALRAALEGRYEILEEIGRGGMAIVFLAHERKHDRTVVVKVLKPAVAFLYGAERFEREVQLAARLSHPHILGLIDSGAEDGLFYYVMPHVVGATLRDRLDAEGALGVEEALPLLHDVASALAYAHALNVIHRDLKPGNVLCAGSHAYLMDFGIAKTVRDEDLTRGGQALGTPRYMAPEQQSGDSEVDQRADVYAWGLLAYEMLAGEPPPRREPGFGPETVRRELRQRCPACPAGLVEVVARCLEPDRGRRLSSAREILGTFEGAGFPAAGAARRGTLVGRSGRRVALGAAGLALVAVAALLLGRGGAPAAADVPAPIAVAPFVNETGDPSLDPLGRLAADWIAQGLQQTGALPVLPWPTVLEILDGEGEVEAASMASVLTREGGAGTVITGAYYDLGDELRFTAVVVDGASGGILTQPQPVSSARDEAERAIRELRDRIMGGLALLSDERLAAVPGLSQDPPTFEAYRSFDRGMRRYVEQDYGAATDDFLDAYRRDTTFVASLLYAATTLHNTDRFAEADSLLGVVEARRERLSEYQDNRLSFLRAVLTGDGARALRLARLGAELGPGSRAPYNQALLANGLNRPAEALGALEAVDPDLGAMRGWAQYWTQLAHAAHLLGDFARELEAASEMRRRYPERRVASVLQARALAAAGDRAGLALLLDDIAALSPRTYWSYGAALVVAGEEIGVHGAADEEAAAYWERAVAWLQGQLASEPGDRPHRYWLGSALYDLGRWAEARAVFEGLVEDAPDSPTYRGMAALAIGQMGEADSARAVLGPVPRYDPGEHLAFRARLESVIGEPDAAVDLFSDALARGVGGFPWLHASAFQDLWALEDDPRFRRLLASAGSEE